MIKLIGALLILISGSSIGWITGSIYINRVRELKELQLAINILDTEISYGRTLLPEALKAAELVLSAPLAGIFSRAADRLNKEKNNSFFNLWQEILSDAFKNCSLQQEDMDILLNWGRQIGATSLEDQLKINRLTLKRLEQHEAIADEIAAQRVKLVRYAGVLVSLIVIILFY